MHYESQSPARTRMIAHHHCFGRESCSNVRSTPVMFARESEEVVSLILLPSTSKQLLEFSLVRPLKST